MERKILKNKLMKGCAVLMGVVLPFLLCWAVLTMGGSLSARAADAASIRQRSQDLSGIAWDNPNYADISGSDYVKLDNSGGAVSLTTARTFSGEYSLTYKMDIISGAFAEKQLYALELGLSDIGLEGSVKMNVYESDVTFTGKAVDRVETHFASGDTRLWVTKKWCPFAPVLYVWNDSNYPYRGLYDFKLDVFEDRIEVYILPTELKHYVSTETFQKLYTVYLKEGSLAEGHIAFTTANSAYDFSIGALEVFSGTGSNPYFSSGFNSMGSIVASEGNTADANWVTNNISACTAFSGANYVDVKGKGQNHDIISNFAFDSTDWSVTYQIKNLTNVTWNDLTSRIDFLFGISDARPQGYVAGFMTPTYMGFFTGGSFPNKDLGANALWRKDIRIKISPGAWAGVNYLYVQYSTQNTDGTWTAFATVKGDGGAARLTDYNAGLSNASGKIGLRTTDDTIGQPSFSVQLIEVTGNVADTTVKKIPKSEQFTDITAKEDGTVFYLELPLAYGWSAAADYRAVWAVTKGGDFAEIEYGALKISGLGEVELTLAFDGIPGTAATYSFNVVDGTPPVLLNDQIWRLASKGSEVKLTELKQSITAYDNVTDQITLIIESITLYPNETAMLAAAGDSVAIEESIVLSEPGIYAFVVSGEDEAQNKSELTIFYVSDGLRLSGGEKYENLALTDAAEPLIIDLPQISTVSSAYVFSVVSGAAAVGLGENSGKLIIYGCGEVLLSAYSKTIPGLSADFSFNVADKVLPSVLFSLSFEKVNAGYELKKSELLEWLEISDNITKSDQLTVAFSINYASTQDGTKAALDLIESLTLDKAGWYYITVTVTDGSGNTSTASATIEVEKADGGGCGSTVYSSGSICIIVLLLLGTAFILRKKRGKCIE